MTIEEILKLPFNKRRTELLKAYVKVLKKKYPESKCKVAGASMNVLFTKDKKNNGKINLSGEWEGWKFHGWKDGWQDSNTHWRYTVSIYPKDTETFILRPLEPGFRSTTKQRSTLVKAMVNHSGCVLECPSDDRWMEFISIKRASNLLDALFSNKKVAVVFDMTADEIDDYFIQEGKTEIEMEAGLKGAVELKNKVELLYKEQEQNIMGSLVPLFNNIHIASRDGNYTIILTKGSEVHSKPCTQPEFMYFKLRNHPENNYKKCRMPVIYLAKKYFCDILDCESARGPEPQFIYTTDESFKLVHNEVITDIGSNRELLTTVLEESFKTGDYEKKPEILIQGRYIHNLVEWNLKNDEYQFRMIGHKERYLIAREFNQHLFDWITGGNTLYMTLGVFLSVSDNIMNYPQDIANYDNLLERIVKYEKNRDRKPVSFLERVQKLKENDSEDMYISRTVLYFSVDYSYSRK